MAQQGGAANLYSTTAFFINLEKLLLEFSNRFMKDPLLTKLMSVSPQYFTMKKNESTGDCKCCEKGGQGVHLEGFDSETTIVADNRNENETDEIEQNLFSDFFFMTHVALDLGMNQAHREIKKIGEEIGKIRECVKIMKSSTGKKEVFIDTTMMTENGPIIFRKIVRDEEELKMIKNQIYTQHSCLRTAMMNPQARENMNTFY
eukprot:TRINITY_DN16680_c1_g1_i1.p1 TRINITY_DN16680_c1_g1~~TRINITY_DN16680_c1_g1_i1.p1  ORF type:complete len:203 (-),score=47.27 TRINITY_DN16680_c1_g1_i1:180-788(-)